MKKSNEKIGNVLFGEGKKLTALLINNAMEILVPPSSVPIFFARSLAFATRVVRKP
jgi:hypothetical protein